MTMNLVLQRLASREVERLRSLGRQVAEIAADPVQKKHIQIWKNVNDLHMTKPALLARDNPLFMMNVDDELTTTVQDPFFADVEQDLLVKIYEWKHVRLHRVVLPEVKCKAAVSDSLFGITASAPDANKLNRISEASVSSARAYKRIIDSEADLQRIERPRIIHDAEETSRRFDMLQAIFSGILDVRLQGIDYFRFTPWDDLLSWMSIEQGMYDLAMNPEFMHRAVRRYVDAAIFRAREYERLGLITSNNTNTCVGSGGYGFSDRLPLPTPSGIGGRLIDNWGDCTDQIFTAISPAMSAEFAFAYENEWASQFHWLYYGCCERLDQKIPELSSFINLRKVSMSPFADLENGMQQLQGKDIVVSFKPNSNHLTLPEVDYGLMRQELEAACLLARKYQVNLEILMKTIITLRGEPQRLWQWCELATEVVDSIFT